MVGAGEWPWLSVVEDGWWWATVVGNGGRRQAVVVVVEERAGDVTVSHNQLDLAGIGLRAARCPQ